MRRRPSATVTMAGGLYIVCGLLVAINLTRVHGTGARLTLLVTCLLTMVVGWGLIQRYNWGRWLALGVSLTGSTLGIWMFVRVMASFWVRYMRPGRLPELWPLYPLILGTLLVLFISLNIRLFRILNSHDGRDEFDTPDTERHVILKSMAFQIGWIATGVLVMRLFPGELRPAGADFDAALRESARMRAQEAARAPVPQGTLVAPPAHVPEIRLDEPREIATPERVAPAATDAPKLKADRQRSRRDFEQGIQLSGQRSGFTSLPPAASGSGAAPADPERASTAILKCRDSSGAISFTQGHCPDGSTRIDTPSAD